MKKNEPTRDEISALKKEQERLQGAMKSLLSEVEAAEKGSSALKSRGHTDESTLQSTLAQIEEAEKNLRRQKVKLKDLHAGAPA